MRLVETAVPTTTLFKMKQIKKWTFLLPTSLKP